MKKLFIAIFALILAAFLGYWLFSRPVDLVTPAKPLQLGRKLPDYVFNDVNISEIKRGVKSWNIKAEKAELYPNAGHFFNPVITLYNNKKPLIRLTSPYAELDGKRRKIEVDKPLAKLLKGSTATLRAEKMLWDDKHKSLSALGNVVLERGQTTIETAKLSYQIENDYVELVGGVKGLHQQVSFNSHQATYQLNTERLALSNSNVYFADGTKLAAQAITTYKDKIALRGRVQFQTAQGYSGHADRAQYYPDKKTGELFGNVRISRQGIALTCQRAKLTPTRVEASGRATLIKDNMRAQADNIALTATPHIAVLSGSSQIKKGADLISSDEIRVDFQTGTVSTTKETNEGRTEIDISDDILFQ